MFPWRVPHQKKMWPLLRSQGVFCCHLFEKTTMKMEICKCSWNKFLLGCWNKKDWEALVGVWGLFLHVNACTTNWDHLSSFRNGWWKLYHIEISFKGAHRQFYSDTLKRLSFPCVSFSRITLALLESGLPASKWSIKGGEHVIPLKRTELFPHTSISCQV